MMVIHLLVRPESEYFRMSGGSSAEEEAMCI